MSDDLVKRLRNRAESWLEYECEEDAKIDIEAADRIKELEAALVVFAKRSEWYDEDDPGSLRDWDKEAQPRITIKDLRRARAALEKKDE
jgi:hypothetical protein